MFLDSKIAIVDLIRDLVITLRKTGVVTSIDVLGGGIYRINAVNTLVENELVTIGSGLYKAVTVTPTNFRVQSDSAVAGASFTGTSPYFEHGHFLEIANKLMEKDSATELYKYTKYPLIALIQDFPETREDGQITEARLNILIINCTEQSYDAAQRYTSNFKPILYELYDSLLQAFTHSRRFGGTFRHTKYDRLAWGTQLPYYNERAILDDFVDAVELQDLTVQLINSPC